MMVGSIIYLNRHRGMFIVQLNDGSCSVLEALGGFEELSIGTKLQGALDQEGDSEILNLESGEQLEVVIQNVGCTPEFAQKRADLR